MWKKADDRKRAIFCLNRLLMWDQAMGNVFVIQWKQKRTARFIVAEWKKDNYTLTIGSKSIFVTDGEKVFKINEDTVIAIPELDSNHEEADTRMMLHTQHASQHFQKILYSIPDTYFHHLFTISTCHRCKFIFSPRDEKV